MTGSNTLLNYEVALEMKWFTQALQNQGLNYGAACEFTKILLNFKKIAEKEWPDQPLFRANDKQGNYDKLEKYFFKLQNVYAIKARERIDDIRESVRTDGDIPDVIEQRLVQDIKI
jgi:hypothetical protein